MGGTDLRDDELIATLTALAGYYLTRADLRRTGQFVAAVVGVVVVCGCLQGKGLLGWLLFVLSCPGISWRCPEVVVEWVWRSPRIFGEAWGEPPTLPARRELTGDAFSWRKLRLPECPSTARFSAPTPSPPIAEYARQSWNRPGSRNS